MLTNNFKELYPARPELTEEMIKEAAEKTAKHASNLDESDRDGLADTIAECWEDGMNGYELSKELECKTCISVNAIFVQDMDMMGFYADSLLIKAQLQWVIDNDIQPPLPIGTMIEEGEITGIAHETSPACYLVLTPEQKESNSSARRVIRFESAIPV